MAINDIVRFRVIGSDGRCSEVWRAWSVRNNVYVAPRMKGGEFKISLHESGKWRLAFTDQYAKRMANAGTRLDDRSRLPLNDPSGRIMIAGANDQGWFCVIDAASY